MSPFAHLLYDMRMRRNVRQVELAVLIGYEQSYISALETGLKGPPTPEFVARLEAGLALDATEREDLRAAVAASDRKLVIQSDISEAAYWLLSRLREEFHRLSAPQIRMINEV